MSHVTDVRLRIHDLDALAEAAEYLGMELRRDQKTFAWWGVYVGDSRDYGEMRPEDMGKCAHALRIKGDKPQTTAAGPWEIAVVPAKDGDGYKLFYDTYGMAGQRLTAKVEQNANALRREYAAAVASQKARQTLGRDGWRLERHDTGRRIQLKLRKR